MRRTGRLLIALADGERARFVRPDPEQGMVSDTAMDSLGAHPAQAPLHEPDRLAKDKFARTVARHLNEAAANGACESLVIVAPTRTLNAIRGELDRATGALVIGALAMDLIRTPNHELAPHLHAWVRPVHRATRLVADARK